ncbi:hypothetical protein [Hamadaea tsunoensis]|uniref:hypothetical protein n=1 Tax=Hamadaea tsunoensis TaxID=53368 RepID=UPI0004231288|nr:hypothetical protein [Hamadaea tsunoensis]
MDLPSGVTSPVGGVVSADLLTHNKANAATGGIWRVTGTDGTAILKIARPPADPPHGSAAWPTSDEPTHWNYWKRETLAYSTGLTGAYADAGILAPALLSQQDRADGSIASWLADADGVPGTEWTPAMLGSFAAALGTAQAAYANAVPDLPWLSRRWLAGYLGRADVWAKWDVDWDHPLASAWPADVRADLETLWRNRFHVLEAAERAPRTLAHLDVWPMNLIAPGSGFTLLDWAFTGEGGVGEDAANLLIDSVTDGYLAMDLLPEITEAITDGYTGATGTGPEPIHAYAAAKYAWFGPAVMGRAIHEGAVGSADYGVRQSVDEHLDRLRPLVTLLARWGRETLSPRH